MEKRYNVIVAGTIAIKNVTLEEAEKTANWYRSFHPVDCVRIKEVES